MKYIAIMLVILSIISIAMTTEIKNGMENTSHLKTNSLYHHHHHHRHHHHRSILCLVFNDHLKSTKDSLTATYNRIRGVYLMMKNNVNKLKPKMKKVVKKKKLNIISIIQRKNYNFIHTLYGKVKALAKKTARRHVVKALKKLKKKMKKIVKPKRIIIPGMKKTCHGLKKCRKLSGAVNFFRNIGLKIVYKRLRARALRAKRSLLRNVPPTCLRDAKILIHLGKFLTKYLVQAKLLKIKKLKLRKRIKHMKHCYETEDDDE